MIPLLVLSLLFAQRPGALQPGTGIVTGSIRIAGGGPAAGVRVAATPVDDPSGTSFLSVAETDASGRFRLTNIPAGRYYIVAGRVTNLTYYPGGTDRAGAVEVVVDSAKVRANVDFAVPADSKRPVALPRPPASPEWDAYHTITLEKNPAKKLNLLLNFEQKYPQSKQLPEVYTSLMDIYVTNHNETKASEYGAKALKLDPENVTALILMSRKFAWLQRDFPNAMQYAQRAVAAAAKLKMQPAPAGAATSWQSWVASLEANAQTNLTWVRGFQASEEKALLSAMTRKR